MVDKEEVVWAVVSCALRACVHYVRPCVRACVRALLACVRCLRACVACLHGQGVPMLVDEEGIQKKCDNTNTKHPHTQTPHPPTHPQTHTGRHTQPHTTPIHPPPHTPHPRTHLPTCTIPAKSAPENPCVLAAKSSTSTPPPPSPSSSPSPIRAHLTPARCTRRILARPAC